MIPRRQRSSSDAVDEGAVGAVFQQPADQIGQQVLVLPDRRIDAAGHAGCFGGRLLVQRLAHAVQPLELEIAALPRAIEHGRERVRVVRGELRIEGVGSASSAWAQAR